MRREERQAYGLNGVGLGATVVALCVPQLWPHVPWYLWHILLWVGIGLIVLSVVILLFVHLSRKQWMYGILGILGIGMISGGWYYKNLPNKTPLSLLEIYITDQFPGVLPVREDLIADNNAIPLRLRILVTKYYEFTANAYYFSIYIPHSQHSYQICIYLANTFQNSISQQFSWLETSSRIPGDSSTMSQSGMVFTGRVYLYVKDDLQPDQIDELHNIYRQNNLHVQYRGVEYQSHHVWEYERRDSNDLKQFKQQPDHDNL